MSSVVYDFSIVNPPADVAAQLGIAEDDFAYHIVRVRQVDEKPIVIEYTYMPLELIPGLKTCTRRSTASSASNVG